MEDAMPLYRKPRKDGKTCHENSICTRRAKITACTCYARCNRTVVLLRARKVSVASTLPEPAIYSVTVSLLNIQHPVEELIKYLVHYIKHFDNLLNTNTRELIHLLLRRPKILPPSILPPCRLRLGQRHTLLARYKERRRRRIIIQQLTVTPNQHSSHARI